jgi:hypothetical protein
MPLFSIYVAGTNCGQLKYDMSAEGLELETEE